MCGSTNQDDEAAPDPAAFLQTIETMKYLSRDRNIVQFYGACIRLDNLMLVTEFMEVGALSRGLVCIIWALAASC